MLKDISPFRNHISGREQNIYSAFRNQFIFHPDYSVFGTVMGRGGGGVGQYPLLLLALQHEMAVTEKYVLARDTAQNKLE